MFNKNLIFIVIYTFITVSCGTSFKVNNTSKNDIETMLNEWHQDVAHFKYNAYFDKMTDSSVFVGTDALEVWNKSQFMEFSKPFFDKKQTWNFKPLQRNIYFGDHSETAWFDEILDTWMGLCRGSGVVVHTKTGWKIQHYVLSVTVPNEDIQKVIESKKVRELEILPQFIQK